MFKSVFFSIIALLTIFRVCLAGQLMESLAPEYYNQGLKDEMAGNLFEAKTFYEKTLLLNPNIKEKEIILKKIAEINIKLESSPEQLEVPLENGEKSIPNQGIAEKAQVPIEPGPGAEAQKTREFVTYYTGREPFLQACQTQLCQKFIFNNFGISYADDLNYFKAEGMFKECLEIDPYFKPPKINLEILKEIQEGRAVNKD